MGPGSASPFKIAWIRSSTFWSPDQTAPDPSYFKWASRRYLVASKCYNIVTIKHTTCALVTLRPIKLNDVRFFNTYIVTFNACSVL